MTNRVEITTCLGACAICCVVASAQIAPISQVHSGQAEATLAWTNGNPPSTASNSHLLTTFGSMVTTAAANNLGDPTVEAVAEAGAASIGLPSTIPAV